MFKTQEFKAYGSIRKMKVGGACGVILALTMLGMVFSSTVSAEEAVVNSSVVSEKTRELDVPVTHESLDKAVTEAKQAGLVVKESVVIDTNVSVSENEFLDRKSKVEKDYEVQAEKLAKETKDYVNTVNERKDEQKLIKSENDSKKKQYEEDYKKYEVDLKKTTEDNLRIDSENNKKNEDYLLAKEKREEENRLIRENNRLGQENYEKDMKAYNDLVKANTDSYEAEKKRVEEENRRIRIDHENALKMLKEQNDNIDLDNKNAKENYDKELKKYNDDLDLYNKEKAKLEKLGLVGSSTGVKLYGDYNESGRGSLDFYKNFHAVFEGVKDLERVNGYLSASPKTEVKFSRKDLLEKTYDTKEGGTGFFLKNIKKGDYFTLNNIGRTESGKSIVAKFTFTADPIPEFKVNGNDNIQPRMNVEWSKTKEHSEFVFSSWNYQITDLDIEYFDEATGKPINLAYVNVLTDLDYDQMYRFEYQDGSTGILKIHSDSELTKVVENGKEFIKGTINPAKFNHDDPSGLDDFSVGSILGTGVLGESSVPKGSLMSVGWGSKNHLTYTASRYSKWVGTNNTRPESQYYAYKAYLEEIAKKEGKPAPTDLEITNVHGYTFGLWGVNSSIQRPLIPPREPHKPVVKQKDKDKLPEPSYLELPKKPEDPKKPVEFIPTPEKPLLQPVPDKPHKTLPPKPVQPEYKSIPEDIPPRTVKVQYKNLKYKPIVKPTKEVLDSFGNDIDGATTFDKNVKFSLTTDYKPYSTFTVDSKTYGKTWAMADDVQDGAYMVDDSKITMKDSTGKDVKALFNMYHVLSEKGRTQEIQNILKEAGLNPKGEFYLWVAKDSASFYQNYVKQAKNITIDLPARLLVAKGEIVKNDFSQIDFSNGFVSNLVTVQIPDLKPEKHALDHKDNSKVRDGQEIKIGEYLRYLLDGVTVPAKHDTIYQYDGIDMLDLKHDRYTGNWSGIIRGTEYVAEKDLVLPYDVVLSDGKVVKAGDKIAKGASYTFQFEFDQSTNSDFINKIVKVTWNEQDGKWAYTIDKEFLNSLGVQGTFDADFYIEVERIASGQVENTFVNIVNGQEMEAKVITHTPEPEKPQEPNNPSLPNTGTASSMLGFVGTGILSMLGLVGIKRKKD